MTSRGTGSDAGISNAASRVPENEVFLSFRGPDTRNTFTDYLYNKLIDSGIRAYRDEEKLKHGKEIGPELRKAIEQSKIAIPILSKNYAKSKWCLKELVQIMERKKQGVLKVMPVFYDVSPSEVRKQAGNYKEAFMLHKKNNAKQTIQDWRGALTDVGKLKGWDLHTGANKKQGDLVKKITQRVLRELKNKYLRVNENAVGLEDHVEEILSKIEPERRKAKVLGIYGMGGVGKTTLARVIYNRLLRRFEWCSFLADIRTESRSGRCEGLRKKLISDILGKESADNIGAGEEFSYIVRRFPKVLILLDDVDEYSQIGRLIGDRDWHAPGSIIIITTRYEHILDKIVVDWRYEPHTLHRNLALQLFCEHAFRDVKPREGYEKLSEKVVEKSGGLPLYLEVTGSLLHGKSVEEWGGTLERLEKTPPQDVTKTLEISFEALEEEQEQILLDIACFFIGVDYRMAIHFWDGLVPYPEDAIGVLESMSLIKIGADNLIWMHDLVREVCRYYIGKGHVGEPQKRPILWNRKQVEGILMGKMVAKRVRGLFLEFDMQSQSLYTAENFAKLPNLKFLLVKGDDISQAISLFGRGLETIARLFSLFRSPFVLSKLRWLSWCHFPPTYRLNNFSLRNLVFLDLSESSISDGWDYWSRIKTAGKLKVLNLSKCEKLTKTPDFSGHLHLEQLILEGCSSLIEVDNSIRKLKHLQIINLKGCRSLRKLPEEFDKTAPLFELDLSYSGIVELPDSIGKMENLKILKVDGCNIRELPTCLGSLERLEVISADCCDPLESIPNLPHSLISLTVRSKEGRQTIPDFSNLTRLKHLTASFRDVPCDQPEVEIRWCIGVFSELVDLKVSFPQIHILHGDLGKLSQLKELVLEECHRLRSIPKLPSSLTILRVDGCRLLRSLPDLSHLEKLRDLFIRHTPIHEVEGLQRLENLRKFVLNSCGIRSLPDMSNLKKLKILTVESCQELVEIQGRSLESLQELRFLNCNFLDKIPDIPNRGTMKSFSIEYCGRSISMVPKIPSTEDSDQHRDEFKEFYEEAAAQANPWDWPERSIFIIFILLLTPLALRFLLLELAPWTRIFLCSILLIILGEVFFADFWIVDPHSSDRFRSGRILVWFVITLLRMK